MKSKVLIIDDSRTIVAILSDLLLKAGFEVESVLEGSEAIHKVLQFMPDLVLLDIVMPSFNGIDFCKVLRNDTRTSHLPIILITSKNQVEDKVAGLEAGADDYVLKPFEEVELIARIKTNLRRARQEKSFNPLTGLPGNVLIEELLKKKVNSREKFAFMYADLDNFKAYNDAYGFLKGDEILRAFSTIIQEAVAKKGRVGDFVGHIGGEDFVVITTPDKAEDIAKEIIRDLKNCCKDFYNQEDAQREYIEGINRQGVSCQFPLVSVSIGIAHNEKRDIKTHWEVVEIATELNKYAKKTPGNIYAKDQRSEESGR